jgi:hypothetical protein
VVGFSLSLWKAYRMFSPAPWNAEDANSISEGVKGRFFPWLDKVPASVTHVYEYDSKGFFPDTLLKFTIRDRGEYEACKSQVTGERQAEVTTAFAKFSWRHTSRRTSWWTPPNSAVYKILYHYFAFDDANQIVYMMYTSPD